MPPIKNVWVVLGLVTVCVQCPGADTFGQVAFTPTIGLAPTGQTMTVTPVVTPDRRYVRLSVNPFFNVINGFSTFTTPLGAVSGAGGVGGGAGGLGGGGLGGAGGLGGGAGGGLRGVGLGPGGANFNAGMNGVIGPAGLDESVAFGQRGFAGQVGELKAGALPYDGDLGGGLYTVAGPGWIGWDDGDFLSVNARPRALTSRSETTRSSGASVATGIKPANSQRQATRKSASRRQKPRASHTAKVKELSDEEPIVKPKKPS